MKKYISIIAFICAVISIEGCSTPQPLTYLALEKPAGKIVGLPHPSVDVAIPRGGFFILNNNFRPAANIDSYITEAQKQAGSSILLNADVTLNLPIGPGLLFFGYASSNDHVTARGR